MTRLLLIRHGQTTSNLVHALDTQLPGAALTDLGWHQAHAAGERIAGERDVGTGADAGSDLFLVSSQALRARQTAAGIATGAAGLGVQLGETAPGSVFASGLARTAGLEITGGLESAVPSVPSEAAVVQVPTVTLPLVMPGAVPGISEIPAGEYEMRSDDEAQYHYHRVYGDWLGGSMDLAIPGALTGRAVVDRYLDALLPMLGTAQRSGADLAVVSHGAVIRLIAAYLGRIDPEYAVRTLLPNTSRVELEVPVLPVLPVLATTDAPTVDTASVLAEAWKVTDWAGHGEPPRSSV